MKIGIILSAGIWAGIAMFFTGCGSTWDAHSATADGRILISADAAGMRAFGDTMNGMITNGKATPDVDTAAWKIRKIQEENETVRAVTPGFWGKLAGPSAAGPK